MIDKQLWRIVLFIFGLAYFFSVGFSVFQKAALDLYQTFTYSNLVFQQTINYITKLVFLVFAVRLTARMIQYQWPWPRSLFTHAFLLFAFAGFSAFSLMLLSHYLFSSEYTISVASWLNRLSIGLTFNYFIYLATVSIVYAYLYSKKQEAQALHQSALSRQLADTKLLQLQNQLRPHFLFNTLNGISAMIEEDPLHAQDAIADLSGLLRYSLHLKDKKLISLEKEIEVLRKYINIIKLRFDEKIFFDFIVDDYLNQAAIPPFLLQPLVENIIIHAFDAHHTVVHVSIKVSLLESSQKLLISIENNGAPLVRSIKEGTGLSNVKERLKTIYGVDAEFDLTQSEKFVIATILIPYTKLPVDHTNQNAAIKSHIVS